MKLSISCGLWYCSERLLAWCSELIVTRVEAFMLFERSSMLVNTLCECCLNTTSRSEYFSIHLESISIPSESMPIPCEHLYIPYVNASQFPLNICQLPVNTCQTPL